MSESSAAFHDKHAKLLIQHKLFVWPYLSFQLWAASLLYSSLERGRVDHKSLPEELACQKGFGFIHLIRTPCALREALITTHTMSFHASNGSISPNIKLFLWFFSLWRFSSYFRHVPGCRLSFFSPYCTQMVVADLTLEERTCLNLLFSSCMLGDLGLARWSPPLLFSPFPPPSARITCGTEDRETCQNVITYENKSVLLQFKTDAC